jgi:hypothetical protein
MSTSETCCARVGQYFPAWAPARASAAAFMRSARYASAASPPTWRSGSARRVGRRSQRRVAETGASATTISTRSPCILWRRPARARPGCRLRPPSVDSLRLWPADRLAPVGALDHDDASERGQNCSHASSASSLTIARLPARLPLDGPRRFLALPAIPGEGRGAVAVSAGNAAIPARLPEFAPRAGNERPPSGCRALSGEGRRGGGISVTSAPPREPDGGLSCDLRRPRRASRLRGAPGISRWAHASTTPTKK